MQLAKWPTRRFCIGSLPLDGGGLGVKRGFRGACVEPAERHSACKPMRGAQLEVKTLNTCGFTGEFSPLPNPLRQGEGVKNPPPRQGEGVNASPRCQEEELATARLATNVKMS